MARAVVLDTETTGLEPHNGHRLIELACVEIDDYIRWRLLEGLDDIGLTLRHEDAIDAFERSRPAHKPVTTA